jgi:hypothetical protein
MIVEYLQQADEPGSGIRELIIYAVIWITYTEKYPPAVIWSRYNTVEEHTSA